jgi:arginyl-tRNA synthetase
VNGVLPWAKMNRCNPRELGMRLLGALEELDHASVPWKSIEIAGPGFLNFRLSEAHLASWLIKFSDSTRLDEACGSILAGQRVVVDFSSPNTAKQMHVGHIRSTVIGDAICRMLEFAGADVVRDNHIGDWGTQFGILIMIVKKKGIDLQAMKGDRIEQLEHLYREGNALTQENEEALDLARSELVKLQNGDPENKAIWDMIVDVSYQEFEKIYNRLGITFDIVNGESFYRDKVEQVYTELKDASIAEESDGAWVVFHPEHPRFAKQPFIIRKSDGASNYATTDLATALYRSQELNAEKVINITDSRQKDHFEQLELTVRKWFETKSLPMPEMRHITFGTILGKDGRAIKTRSGGSVKLKELLDEAVERASAITREKNPELNGEELQSTAEAVGIGAVRYADLSQNRSSDYQFDWDKMLAFEGNTAPYLMYSVASIHGIFRKLGIEADAVTFPQSLNIEQAEEIALVKQLSNFPLILKQALDDYRPHFLCAYLYELCGAFNAFYHVHTVLHGDDSIRLSRLFLCSATLNLLSLGLDLLGIKALRRM